MGLDELLNSTEPGQLSNSKRHLASSDTGRETKRHCAQPGGLGWSSGSAALGFGDGDGDGDGVGTDGYDRSWVGGFGTASGGVIFNDTFGGILSNPPSQETFDGLNSTLGYNSHFPASLSAHTPESNAQLSHGIYPTFNQQPEIQRSSNLASYNSFDPSTTFGPQIINQQYDANPIQGENLLETWSLPDPSSLSVTEPFIDTGSGWIEGTTSNQNGSGYQSLEPHALEIAPVSEGHFDKPLANMKWADSGESNPAGVSINVASGEKSPGKFVKQDILIKIV